MANLQPPEPINPEPPIQKTKKKGKHKYTAEHPTLFPWSAPVDKNKYAVYCNTCQNQYASAKIQACQTH